MYALIFLKYIENPLVGIFSLTKQRRSVGPRIRLRCSAERKALAKVGGNPRWERKKRGKTDGSSDYRVEGRKQREVYTA